MVILAQVPEFFEGCILSYRPFLVDKLTTVIFLISLVAVIVVC